MLDFERDEKELFEKLEAVRNQKPPVAVMDRFEEGVMQKLSAPAPGSNVGVYLVVGFGLVFAFALGLAFLYAPRMQPKPEVVTASPTLAPVAAVEVAPSQQIVPETIGVIKQEISEKEESINDEALFKGMSEDLFILEMLGEDVSFISDMDRVAMDLEMIGQLPLASTNNL